ncbi:hypothetical protein [Arsukibacterium indicum]|uniref:Lipoprotein n=1 Tax=Arsukibacterium indicum TaxID=2848612 RepID=A0ABS6MK78_9GAMM|nr:hypothetical protein [Arsukibacterium indicum]MBV2129226.1 hypothetical protein [Arsukibacterium indicum]
MKNTNKFLSLIALSTLAGCAQLPPDTNERLGQFTAASSFNVRNLEYEKSTNTVSFTTGKSCYLVNMVTLAYISGPKDNLLQRAMDDAIRNGQQSGIDGDLLVNTRIERKTEYKEKGEGFFKVRERYECVFVEGDLVKIKK